MSVLGRIQNTVMPTAGQMLSRRGAHVMAPRIHVISVENESDSKRSASSSTCTIQSIDSTVRPPHRSRGESVAARWHGDTAQFRVRVYLAEMHGIFS